MEAQKVTDCLVSFVERASKNNATPEEIQALPEVAKILLDYWIATCPR